jgi:hypothetical protein
MLNDSKGKTSLMKFLCFIAGLLSSLVFAVCSFAAFFMIIFEAKTDVTNILTTLTMQSVGLFTVSIGAVTTRRFTQDKTLDYGEQG